MHAMIPIGYPTGRWGMASRKPANEFVYSEHWDNPVTWTGLNWGESQRTTAEITNKRKRWISLPEKTPKAPQKDLDFFIEDVIKPIEQEDDNIRFLIIAEKTVGQIGTEMVCQMLTGKIS